MRDWLMASSDQEESAALTAALVAIRSYPGEEGPVQRAVAAWLAEQGVLLSDLRVGRQSLEEAFLRLTSTGVGVGSRVDPPAPAEARPHA